MKSNAIYLMSFIFLIFLSLDSFGLQNNFNFTVNVYNRSDLNLPFIFNWSQDIAFNAFNSSAITVDMNCSPWIHGCISPIVIENQTHLNLNLQVPNSTLSGLYHQNLTLLTFNSSSLSASIVPNKIQFNFNVTYFFNYSIPSVNHSINQSNTSVNITTTIPYNITRISKGKYTYLQNELPTNFTELITLFGSNTTHLSVTYDTWLSGPKSINLTGTVLEGLVDVNIPKVAVGTYLRHIYYYDPAQNLSKNYTIQITVRPPEYDHTKLENWENLDNEERLKFAITFLDSYYQKILVNISSSKSSPELINKYRVTPVNYEYLSDIFEKAKHSDPKLIAKYEELSQTASSLNKSYISSLDSCTSSLSTLRDENSKLRVRNLDLASIHNNDSLTLSSMRAELRQYDHNHVKNSTFWIPMTILILIVLYYGGRWGKEWYEEYLDL